jgi:hypothetical protein
MTPAEVLRKAADLIEERGWWDGVGVKPRHCECVMTAVDSICTQFDLEVNIYADALIAVGDAVDMGPARWNDAQPNGGVVIAKLREVADGLERAS